jgi:UDP-GlcNAc3NAcA epimerase
MLEKLEQVMLAERSDMVLIYGDTNSTLAGALAAAKLNIPLAHVEAGVRSFNHCMPEEINRIVADHLSSLLFCPTQTAVGNLASEGIRSGVHMVGDVMCDMTLTTAAVAEQRSTILRSLGLTPGTYAVTTIHRAENTDNFDRFQAIMAWLGEAAAAMPVIMPVHPRTRMLIESCDLDLSTIQLIEPLSYLDMAKLLHNAAVIFTDSGGLQKEAYFHRVPCVTLREETEWIETVEAGWNRLWTTPNYAPRRDISDFGNGESARNIVGIIEAWMLRLAAASAPRSRHASTPSSSSTTGDPTAILSGDGVSAGDGSERQRVAKAVARRTFPG